MKILKRAFLVALGIILAIVIVLGIDIYTYPRGAVKENADAAIVLGAAIWTDKPSPVFRERLNHAVKIYKENNVKKIIVTGGFGEGERFSEAEIGEKYLIENGVLATDIFKEDKSQTTLQNLENSVPIAAENHLSTVLIVSDSLHLRRSVRMAKNLGLDAYPSATMTSRYQGLTSQFNFLLREIYFYLGYLIFGR